MGGPGSGRGRPRGGGRGRRAAELVRGKRSDSLKPVDGKTYDSEPKIKPMKRGRKPKKPGPRLKSEPKLSKTQLFTVAKRLCDMGDFSNGLPKLTHLVTLSPKDATFRAYLAHFYQESGSYDEAIKEAEGSLKINENVLAFKTWFSALFKSGSISECYTVLTKIKNSRSRTVQRLCNPSELELKLDRHLVLMDTTKTLYESGQFDLVLLKCELGITAAPLDRKLLFFKVGALFNKKMYINVVRMIHHDFLKENSECCEWFALSYYMLLEIDVALDILKERREPICVSLFESLKTIRNLWSSARKSNKDPSAVVQSSLSAIKHISEISVLNGELETSLITLAVNGYLQLGNKSDALKLLTGALKKGYKIPTPPALEESSKVGSLLRQDKWTEAKGWIEKILRDLGPPRNNSKPQFEVWTEKLRCVRILEDSQSWTSSKLKQRRTVRKAAELLEHHVTFNSFGSKSETELADLKKSYKACMLKYHPDKNRDKDEDLQRLYAELTKLGNSAFAYLREIAKKDGAGARDGGDSDNDNDHFENEEFECDCGCGHDEDSGDGSGWGRYWYDSSEWDSSESDWDEDEGDYHESRKRCNIS